MPAARDILIPILDEVDLPRPEKVVEWGRTARFLVVASGPWWRRIIAQILSKEYRAAKRALGNPGALSLAPDKLSTLKERASALDSGFASLAKVMGINDLERLPYSDLSEVLNRMISTRTVVANLPRIRELEARFGEAGIGNLIQLVGRDVPPEHAARTVEHAWLGRVMEDLEFEDQQIAAFDGGTHSRHRDEFAEIDRQHRDSTAQRVHRLTAEAIIETMNGHPEETVLVRREAAKSRRHLSVRQLFARAPHVLSTLRPCWTMSPILAAEMIPADLRLFDVVIFDEASQIPPAEAISSLARAPQTVIAGDSRQLPPTSFFGHSADDETEEDDDDLSC